MKTKFFKKRSAIECMLYLGKENVIFEMDGKAVMDVVHSFNTDLSEFGSIEQDCVYLLEQGVNFVYQ